MMWVTIGDAARIARIPERTLRKLVVAATVRSRRASPRKTLVHLDDVCDWKLAQQTRRLRVLADLTAGR